MQTRRNFQVILFLLVLLTTPLFSAAVRIELLGRRTRFETPVYTIESGVDGPTVLVTGGVHENEPAGALAAEQIRHWPIPHGTLVVIPLTNRVLRAQAMFPLHIRTSQYSDASPHE